MINSDIKEIIFTEEEIGKKVEEMGNAISREYEGKDLMLVGVLKGSVMFMSEIMKRITIPCTIDFMAVSSYGNSTKSSGVVRILKDLDHSIEGKNIVIIEDIIDSGNTLQYLMDYLKGRGAASVEVACLLNKPSRTVVKIDAKYLGFEVPDYFLVGYGLDYAEKYRNLPYIGILKEEVYR